MGLKNVIVSAVNNPKLLLGLGIAGFFGAGVWACVQTLKLETIIDEQNDIQDKIVENHSEEELQLPEVKKDINIVKAKTIGRIALNYAGPVTVAGVAAYLLFRSYGLQRQAYLAVSAAYGTISKAYDAVLDRVERKWGQEGLKYAKYGIEQKEVTKEVTDEKGKVKKVKETEDQLTDVYEQDRWAKIKEASPNAIIFDEETSLYREQHGVISLMISELVKYQNYLNIVYNQGSPVFYNDIVRTVAGNDTRWLTDAGQIVGCYERDPENKAATNGAVSLNWTTFTGTDPETGDPRQYVMIDPTVALINLDKYRSVWPTGILQKKRVGGKYISQV